MHEPFGWGKGGSSRAGGCEARRGGLQLRRAARMGLVQARGRRGGSSAACWSGCWRRRSRRTAASAASPRPTSTPSSQTTSPPSSCRPWSTPRRAPAGASTAFQPCLFLQLLKALPLSMLCFYAAPAVGVEGGSVPACDWSMHGNLTRSAIASCCSCHWWAGMRLCRDLMARLCA